MSGSNHKGQYLGCFKDSFAKRDVGNWVTTLRESNSPEKCVEICINGGKFISFDMERDRHKIFVVTLTPLLQKAKCIKSLYEKRNNNFSYS